MGLFNQYEQSYLGTRITNTRSGIFSPVAVFYVALVTGAPTEVDTSGFEVTGNGYTRARNIHFEVDGVPNQCKNTETITFPAATADWGTVVGAVIGYNEEIDGGMQYNFAYFPFPSPVNVTAGDVVEIPAGNLKVKCNTSPNISLSGATDLINCLFLNGNKAKSIGNIALFNGSTEVTAPSYARITITSSNIGVTSNQAQGMLQNSTSKIEFPVAAEDWGTVTHLVINGGLTPSFAAIPFDAPIYIAEGDAFLIDVGNFTFTID